MVERPRYPQASSVLWKRPLLLFRTATYFVRTAASPVKDLERNPLLLLLEFRISITTALVYTTDWISVLIFPADTPKPGLPILIRVVQRQALHVVPFALVYAVLPYAIDRMASLTQRPPTLARICAI